MSGKNNFQEILNEIRSEIQFLQKDLFAVLSSNIKKELSVVPIFNGLFISTNFHFSKDTRQWLLDVFLDKCYEVDVKITKMIKDQLGYEMLFPIDLIKQAVYDFGFHEYYSPINVVDALKRLEKIIEQYSTNVECQLSTIRMDFHKKSWENVKKINTANYVLPYKRATYVSSRQELEKAKQAVKDKQWDEVLNHLRPAVDLAIKEKFGFTKIQPMKSFISDAEKFGLTLPSYTMLYDIFDEGSKRIHEGKLNTPYECQRALEFVAGFIDHLDLINIPKDKIEEFKNKCKFVE